MNRQFRALIVNDYEEHQYAEWIKTGKKSIETRMKKMFSHRGDIVICVGKKNSVGKNVGKAICIVELYDARPMNNTPEEIEAACIGWDVDRKSHLLRNWRYFSRDFEFAPQATLKNFQGLFRVAIPDDVEIIPHPEIKEFVPAAYEKKWQIWMERFSETGKSDGSTRVVKDGEIDTEWAGATFQEACELAVSELGLVHSLYDKDKNSYYGCRFFDYKVGAGSPSDI